MQNAPTAKAVGAFHLGLLFAGFAFLLPAFAQTAAGQGTPALAGKVELVEGDVRFFDRAMTMRRPVTEDSIFEGESIATGPNGEVHLRMEDGGFIAVRPGTRMRRVRRPAARGAAARPSEHPGAFPADPLRGEDHAALPGDPAAASRAARKPAQAGAGTRGESRDKKARGAQGAAPRQEGKTGKAREKTATAREKVIRA